MNFKQLLNIFFVVTIAAFSGCSKSNSNNAKPIVTTTTKPDTDIYAVGYTVKNNIYYATYWKNGVANTLGNRGGTAYSIAVSGNDVYIAGGIIAANNVYTAAYWKNGVIYKLTDSVTASVATSIAIQNNDVYVAGYENKAGTLQTTALFWKNKAVTILPDDTYGSGTAAIALNGSDVYIAGYVDGSSYSPVAAYWKNGVLTQLPGGTQDLLTMGYASGIAVNTNGVITSGYLFNTSGASKIAYWTGNTLTTNYNDPRSTTSYAMALKGNDIYLVGDTLSAIGGIQTATCWKNGSVINLANGGIGSDAYAITILGNDIYVGGFYGAHKTPNAPFLGRAVYWKNGTTVQLSSDTSNVYGMAIAPH